MGPQSYKPVYRSEIQKSSSVRIFKWEKVSILTSELAVEENRVIRFEFFKSSTNGKHTNLGYMSCLIADLRNGNLQFALSGQKEDQRVWFEDVTFDKRHTFLDFIFGGCEI